MSPSYIEMSNHLLLHLAVMVSLWFTGKHKNITKQEFASSLSTWRRQSAGHALEETVVRIRSGASSRGPSRKHRWRRDGTWCHSHRRLQNLTDSQHQTGVTGGWRRQDSVVTEGKLRACVCFCVWKWVFCVPQWGGRQLRCSGGLESAAGCVSIFRLGATAKVAIKREWLSWEV